MSQDHDYIAMVRSLGNSEHNGRAAKDPTVQPFIVPAVAKTVPHAPKEPDFNAMAEEFYHGNPAAASAPDIHTFRKMSRTFAAPSIKR